ncbi:MAG TPA: beta-propeller fold lactonase family protein, partial [Polyangiales bacterium]|nr:beta-propeller fold lactonase family protein [Polyangiales bacterium]
VLAEKTAAEKPAPRELLYVSAEHSGEVVVVDPESAQVVQRIAVGKRPRGLMPSPDGKVLYVAKSGSPPAGPGVDESKLPPPDRAADGVGVIELASSNLVRTLPGGQDPESVAVSRDGKALFIANEETAELSKLDTAAGTISARVKVGQQPEGVSVHPDGKLVYVTCEEDNEVVAVDALENKVLAHIPVGKRPRAIAWSQDGAHAFVTNELDATVSVIDTQSHKAVQQIAFPPPSAADAQAHRPMGIVASSDGSRLFVSTGRGGAIAEIAVAERKVTRLIESVGARPWGIALSADGKRLYSANGPSDDLTIIELASGMQKRIAIGGSPWGVVSVTR